MSFTNKHCSLIIVMLNLLVLTWVDHVISNFDSQKKFFMLDPFDVHITDGEVDNLMVHCKSLDDDLGDKNLAPNQFFHWRFRQNFLFTTVFTCTFRSMTSDNQELKTLTFDVFDLMISTKCSADDPRNCYWLVRNDGFYFSKENKPFPDGWDLKRKW